MVMRSAKGGGGMEERVTVSGKGDWGGVAKSAARGQRCVAVMWEYLSGQWRASHQITVSLRGQVSPRAWARVPPPSRACNVSRPVGPTACKYPVTLGCNRQIFPPASRRVITRSPAARPKGTRARPPRPTTWCYGARVTPACLSASAPQSLLLRRTATG